MIQKEINGVMKSIRDLIRKLSSFFRSRLLICLRLGISLNEDRTHAKILSEFDIRERVAYHYARRRLNLRKITPCRLEHSGQRFPAVALFFPMWTVVESVDLGSVIAKNLV